MRSTHRPLHPTTQTGFRRVLVKLVFDFSTKISINPPHLVRRTHPTILEKAITKEVTLEVLLHEKSEILKDL